MEISLTLSSTIAMFGAMLALAIIPDASTFAVVARSIGSGFVHALVTTIGIIVGDLIFIVLAFYGLSSIAESSYFVIVKYLGGAYLIWLGIRLWTAKTKSEEIAKRIESSWGANFLCGLMITLSDPKAILFYISFLPAFVDLSTATFLDATLIMFMATTAICLTKLTYVCMAYKSGQLFQDPIVISRMNITAACIMICIGILLIVKN
jgi:threonine/homoserine/homoserine lactone efflux protein